MSAAEVRKGELVFEEGLGYASSQGSDLRSDTDLERMCEIGTQAVWDSQHMAAVVLREGQQLLFGGGVNIE